ncbi:MAG: hypothetical protein V1792_11170 [Pseudomonadota bacterium]
MNKIIKPLTQFWLTALSSPAPRNRVIEKIKSFGSLPEGWDFGVGRPAPHEVIDMAVKLYGRGAVLGLRSDAFPGSEGTVYVVFYKGIEAVEFCVNADLSLIVTHERGIGVDFDELDYREGLNYEEAMDYLSRFAVENRCNLSEPYIAINTTRNANDLQVIASRTTKAAYRLSTPNASKRVAWIAVST